MTAQDLERRIKENVRAINSAWVEVARDLYTFHEAKMWQALDYHRLEDWLMDLDIGRRWAFTLIAIWRFFVVEGEVDPQQLHRVAPGKLQVALPAVQRGHADVGDVLVDAETMTRAELRRRYALPELVPVPSVPAPAPRAAVSVRAPLNELSQRFDERRGPAGREMVGGAVRRLANATGREATREALLDLAVEAVAWADRLTRREDLREVA